MIVLVMKFLGVDIDAIIEELYQVVDRKSMVRVGMIDQKTTANLLIIPDFPGYDLSGRGFLPHMPFPPMFEGANQSAVFFQKNMLNYWCAKRETLIFGIGHGGCLVWEYQGGKLDIMDGQVMPLATKGFNGMVDFPQRRLYTAQATDFYGVDRMMKGDLDYAVQLANQKLNGIALPFGEEEEDYLAVT